DRRAGGHVPPGQDPPTICEAYLSYTRRARRLRASQKFLGSTDCKATIDRCAPGSRPSRVFDGAAFVPIVHLPFQNDLVAVLYGDSDRLSLNLRMPLESRLNFALHVRGINNWLDGNLVCHAAHAERCKRLFGSYFLIIPIDVSAQRDKSVLNQH